MVLSRSIMRTHQAALGSGVLALASVAWGPACSSSPRAGPPTDAGVHASVDASTQRHLDANPDRQPSDVGQDVPGFIAVDAQVDAEVDDANCVPPGTLSNDAGVGGYCTPGGGECTRGGPNGGLVVCTADFNVPAHAWFCTIACTATTMCGTGGAACTSSIQGQSCIPAACAPLLAGPDAGDGPPD
jgi:hypothetical protein